MIPTFIKVKDKDEDILAVRVADIDSLCLTCELDEDDKSLYFEWRIIMKNGDEYFPLVARRAVRCLTPLSAPALSGAYAWKRRGITSA